MQVSNRGYTIDALAIVTGDHLLSAIVQIDFFDQSTLAWLHEWTEDQIRQNRDVPLVRAVFEAFNALVCANIENEG